MGIFDRLTGRVGSFFGDFIDEVMIPDEIHVQLERASRALNQDDPDGALTILERIERLRPDLARTHHLMGMSHFYRSAPQEAARCFRRAIELKEHASSHFYAGLAMEQMREWRAAQDHLKRASTLDPKPPYHFELTFAKGRVFLAQGRADKAIKELRKAMRTHKEHPQALLTLTQALLVRGRIQEADAAFKSISHKPDDARTHLLEARLAQALHDTERAYTSYTHAMDAPKCNAEELDQALVGAAQTALDLRRTQKARAIITQAIDQGRGGPRADLHAMLGFIAELEAHEATLWAPLRTPHAIKLNAQPSLTHYADALVQDPDHGDALRGMGRAFLAARQPEDAQSYFQRALATTSHRHIAHSMLGLGLSKLIAGDLTAAKQLLEEAHKVQKDQQDTHVDTYVDTSIDTNTYSDEDPNMWHALGLTALKSGDAAEALVALQRALDATSSLAHHAIIQGDLDCAITRLRPPWNLPDHLVDPGDLDRILQQLQEYIASDPRLVDFLPATQRIIAAINAPLSIAIVGEFNAGKSTLINATIGEEIVPMGVLPTTAHTGIIGFGPRQTARVIYKDTSSVEVNFKDAKKLMKSNADEIDHLEYLYPHPELRTVHFWDTPGFNALDERHEHTAAHALEQAEAILWVLDANQVLSQTEFERIEGLPSGSERLLVVINKIDRLGPPEIRAPLIKELVDYVQKFAGEHIAGCYPISALQALNLQKEGHSLNIDAPDGFAQFQAHLDERIIQRAGRIKTIEGKRHLACLVITLSSFQHGLIQRYKGLQRILKTLRSWLESEAQTRPKQLAREELMQFEDRTDFLLQNLVLEITEALKPQASWTRTKMELGPEDQEFLIALISERFHTLLAHSKERVFQDVGATETGIAQRVGPILQGLLLQDARNINRRLEGFYDEIRMLKLLLEERVYGRLAARTTGQLKAAGKRIFEEIQQHTDHTRWKGLLRQLLPELRDHVDEALESWYRTFFHAAKRFCDRLERDLSLLELEARVRYDITDLEDLVMHQHNQVTPESHT